MFGMLAQAGFGIYAFSVAKTTGLGVIVLGVGAVIILLATAIGIIPLLLLLFRKTRKLGAVLSIVLGIAGISLVVGLFVGFFMIMAGILLLLIRMLTSCLVPMPQRTL